MAQRTGADPHLLTLAARLSYEAGLTHREIAETLGVSRPTATRLISEARARGIVEITIHGPEQLFGDLERRAAEALGLAEVWLAPQIPHDQDRTVQAVATVGGRCIARHTKDAHTVAIGLSATVGRAVEQVPAMHAAGPDVAPLSGSWGGPNLGLNPPEVARSLVERIGGRSFNLPAPVLAPGAAEATGLRALPDVTETLAVARQADVALLGVGGYDWDKSPLGKAVTDAERSELLAAGGVGDVSGRFFDAAGRAITASLDARVVGLTLDELRQAKTRVLIASGESKWDALKGALAGGLVTVLVTDTATVRALTDR